MPSANYVWPQLLNKYARKVIEANGGEVVFEEYYPLDQAEYSATIGKIRDGKVDCVFNTVIPPGLQPFVKQLYESGFQKNGGVVSCVYYDENLLNYHPAQEMEGLDQLPRLLPGGQRSVQQEAAGGVREEVPRHQVPVHRRQRVDRHVSRREVLRGCRQGDQGRPQARGRGRGAWTRAKLAEGPGGGAEMVPGKMHCKMNMYIAVCKVDAGKTRYDVINKADMVDPQGVLIECRADGCRDDGAVGDATFDRSRRKQAARPVRVLPVVELVTLGCRSSRHRSLLAEPRRAVTLMTNILILSPCSRSASTCAGATPAS